MSDPEVQELTFRIGDAFPAECVEARWVTVLAMASNDFLRLFDWLVNASDEGTRLLVFRIIASAFYEVVTHLDDTVRRFPEITTLVGDLDAEAQQEVERMRGAIKPESPFYLGAWFEKHRNVTFHYAEMHPSKATHRQEEISEALRAAEQLSGTISTSEGFGSVRFGFADEVAVQWLPDVSVDGAAALESLRERCLDLTRFTQRAANRYLNQLAAGVVTRCDS
jgi:hypothetical protein